MNDKIKNLLLDSLKNTQEKNPSLKNKITLPGKTMIQKPSFVTGEARQFITYSLFMDAQRRVKIKEFLSQSLTLEEFQSLVNEELSNEYVDVYINKDDFEGDTLHIENIEVVDIKIVKCPIPHTLNDWITVFHLAGITLTWREG